MRVVGGDYKGRALSAPKGMSTRPTSDRTREALFNVLAHGAWCNESFSFASLRVLDLFAGSGALGLEAISRGATFCLFVETDAGARGAIRDNIEALGLFGQTRIHRRSATSLGSIPASAGGPFDLAFLDPPYGKGLVEPALRELITGGWLGKPATLVIEQAVNDSLVLPVGFEEKFARTYGDTRIIIAGSSGA